MMLKRLIGAAILVASGLGGHSAHAEQDYHIHLHGGFFFGPGPIKPDTSLPDGDIAGVVFDTVALRGEARFRPAPKQLSDGKTQVNANIDAGRLGIGDNTKGKVFWLTAVDGGPNRGTEQYAFDAKLNFNWTVDLALDPGFAEGIIRVDNFKLTTGTAQVPRSLQSAQNLPEGYDRAGSLPSGTFLVGRVGDFERSGFINGTLVATANVPIASDMLPGAPVANMRGFSTNIPVDPVTAAEMTLSGVANMRPVVDQLIANNDIPKLKEVLADIGDRFNAASLNCEDAFLKANRTQKDMLQQSRWRLEAARKMFFIPWAFLTGYQSATGKVSDSVQDSTKRGFELVAELLPRLKAIESGPHE